MRDLHLSDKVSVVVNCANRRGSLSVADIERVIQLPVRYMLPESASEIARAVGKGAVLDGSSPLARQILRIAGEIACTPAVTAKAGAMRRFVEYFSISPEREGRLEKVGGAGR
jgi:hypothetical protein